MPRILKTLLLWLLIIALPAQGMAAVAKLSCRPVHHEPMLMSQVQEPHHDEKAAAQQHDHSSDMAAEDDHHAGSLSAAGDTFPDKKQFHKSSSCSACAACCSGAVAPPSPVTLLSAFPASGAVFIVPSTLVTRFIPGSLERPPKSFTA